MTIHAVYENGVFRPMEKVDLPDHCEVEVEIRQCQVEQRPPAPMSEGLARVYDILGRRYASGHTDTAERHNEHQP